MGEHNDVCNGQGQACSPLPPSFIRLRYFFGKRLGVADLLDEQRYHAGKMRFHNMHLHGRGVLCGLGLELFGDTVLRVTRGAALDSCGREIVVGYDQCVDVDAWFQREREVRRAQPGNANWPADTVDDNRAIELCVALRYLECATAPEPAPRDPCACDQGGYENGRVREGFELRLMLRGDAELLPGPAPFPAPDALDSALDSALDGTPAGAGQERCAAIERLLRTGCPGPESDDWLIIGCVTATLDGDLASVTAIAPRNQGRSLFSSALVQRLLCRLLAEAPADALADGPVISGVEFSSEAPHITLRLSGPIAGPTVAPERFALRRFDAGAWSPGATLEVAYNEAGPHIELTIVEPGDFLQADRRYRLARIHDPGAPITDQDMRVVRPLHFTWQFRLVEEGGALVARELR